MAKKRSMAAVGGGILMLIASLLYLYVGYTWYSVGSSTGVWLSAAQFFGPFVAAFALIGAIVLFFMSIGVMAGYMPNDNGRSMGNKMWPFLISLGIAFFIVTAGGYWFYWAVLAFVISYIGAIAKSM